jgi:hypothetical protein
VRPAASGPDLFAAVALAEAEAAAVAAEAKRATAQREFLYAPHGTRTEREQTLKDAAIEALRADIALAKAKREAGL